MKKNLAIIGMAGNFKNAVACKLVTQLHMMLMDCTDYIEYNQSMPVEELVQKTNITYLKKQISKAVKETCDLENIIFCSCDIATLSIEDLTNLKNNCYVIFLHGKTKTVENKYSKIKPMSSLLDEEKLDKLNIQCQKRYINFCDFDVSIDKGSLNDCVDKIMRFLKSLVAVN